MTMTTTMTTMIKKNFLIKATRQGVATHTERWRQTEHVAGRFKGIRRPAQPVFAALPNYASSLALH